MIKKPNPTKRKQKYMCKKSIRNFTRRKNKRIKYKRNQIPRKYTCKESIRKFTRRKKKCVKKLYKSIHKES